MQTHVGLQKSMVPSIMASHPGLEAVKQPQTITLLPPCLIVGMRVFLNVLIRFDYHIFRP